MARIVISTDFPVHLTGEQQRALLDLGCSICIERQHLVPGDIAFIVSAGDELGEYRMRLASRSRGPAQAETIGLNVEREAPTLFGPEA